MLKNLQVLLIDSNSANRFIKRWHYSKKIVQNSCLHYGVMDDGRLKGVMSFGHPMDKPRALNLVKNTKWGGMLELNRMAFVDELPKNSESRCLAIALRHIRKNYPHKKWVQTYADGCQCGDGTIYRAVGFSLIGIKKNNSLKVLEDGRIISRKTLDDHSINGKFLSSLIKTKPLEGFQVKYIYFLDSEKKKDLTVPILPYSEIEKAGAKMYKGIRASSSNVEQQSHQIEEDGAVPIDALQLQAEL